MLNVFDYFDRYAGDNQSTGVAIVYSPCKVTNE